jgi:hypothetical protein
VAGRVLLLLDDLWAKVFLGGQGVMRRAAQRQIRGDVLAAVRKGLQVM